jgi:competence protein ComEC
MRTWKYAFIFVGLLTALLTIAVIQLPDGNLHIIACDVGQGDAILIIHKNIQIITDGGPDDGVLTCLGRHIPFWDRQVELVISTHPDGDHITGLIEIIKRFEVDKILTNPINPGTQTYRLLESVEGSRGITHLNPDSVTDMRLGLIYLDVVSSSDSIKGTSTNKNSIVYLLGFGRFKGVFTGDITSADTDSLAKKWDMGPVNYIKIPHHGSNNGLTQNLLEKIVPEGSNTVGVISVGKDNQWKFPAKEILEMLEKYKVKILRTDEVGDAEVVTDGERFWIKD